MTTTSDDTVRFDPTAPLPTGRLAIEASAGTGKTYTLAGLATRFVVEAGVPINELLVVTFTRAAAAELQSRIRSKLVESVAALESAVDDPANEPADDVLRHLCGTDRHARLGRARRALADFDSAVIGTMHAFAQQMLATLGIGSGEADAVLADDGGALLHQVCIDTIATSALRGTQDVAALPGFATLSNAARAATGNPGAIVLPALDDDLEGTQADAAMVRRELVDAVLAETARRRRATATLSFDDLLTRLRDALTSVDGTDRIRDVLRKRFRVALIDEFQDTDPVQWSIFSSMWDVGTGGDDRALVVVGDPKQAIYAFRGADIHTYLDAVRTPGTTSTSLGTNWRSDGRLLTALDRLLDGTTFGDDHIRFHRVEPSDANRDSCLRDRAGNVLPALSLRLALGEGIRPNSKAFDTTAATDAIHADLASAIRDLLESTLLPDGTSAGGARPLRPSDVAVLVRSNAESAQIRRAFERVGIPAVIARGDSVLRSEAAEQWRWLLDALTNPADAARARTACHSWFVGWTADTIATASEDDLAVQQERFARWADVLRSRGPVTFVRTVRAETGIAARLQTRPDGDRAITDIDHIAELLAARAPARTGPAGLLATLTVLQNGGEARSLGEDVTERRVESGADAVQIMTVHVAKGLEFPVVCCPSLWKGTRGSGSTIAFSDDTMRRRHIDIAADLDWVGATTQKERKRLNAAERSGEDLRLLYVAMTRAKHLALVWWTRTTTSSSSALARVLFGRTDGRPDPAFFGATGVKLGKDHDAVAADLVRAYVDPDTTEVTVIGAPPDGQPKRWTGGTTVDDVDLALAVLPHAPDRSSRRWSFSQLTAGSWDAPHDPLDASAGDAGAADEDDLDVLVAPDAADELPPTLLDDRPLPLGTMRGGRTFGNLVHKVFELADFTAVDLDAELHRHVDTALRSDAVEVDVDALVAGLTASLDTPIGPIVDGRPLRTFTRADRIDELGFEITLGEGGTAAKDAEVGRVICDHLADGDRLVPWARSLADGRFGKVLAGHLVGYVDAVLRVRSDDGPDRFVVVDYKTNNLTPRGAVPSLADYGPAGVTRAMAHSHYPLQALLYSVGLHRYLRWRLRGYDPAVHLGGIAYLFVRGMTGADTPIVDGTAPGVFAWRPPAALVTDLSDLLDGGRRP